MTSRPTETNILYIFLAACLIDSFPIGPERKHKSDFFASFYTTRYPLLEAPKTFRARKAIRKTATRSFCKGTRRRGDFELCEPNPKLKSGCNVYQFLWLTMAVWYDLETHGNEYEHIFLAACLVDSSPIGPERKHKSDFFASFYTTRPFSINYSISKFNGDPGHWQGK